MQAKLRKTSTKLQNNCVSPFSSLSSSLSIGKTQTPSSNWLLQVSVLVLKSVTSANFHNGLVLARTDASVYSPGAQPLLTTAANTLTPISSGTDYSLGQVLLSAAGEQIKSNLLMYLSNMQTMLLSTVQVNLHS